MKVVCKADTIGVEFTHRTINEAAGGPMTVKEKRADRKAKSCRLMPAVNFWLSLDGSKVAKLGNKEADTLGVKTWPNPKVS